MVRVYGGCIEPGGMELEDGHTTTACPKCGATADAWHCERLEAGCINIHSGLACSACGHHEGEDPDDSDRFDAPFEPGPEGAKADEPDSEDTGEPGAL